MYKQDLRLNNLLVQSAGAVEYTDSTSEEGWPPTKCPDMTLDNLIVMLQ